MLAQQSLDKPIGADETSDLTLTDVAAMECWRSKRAAEEHRFREEIALRTLEKVMSLKGYSQRNRCIFGAVFLEHEDREDVATRYATTRNNRGSSWSMLSGVSASRSVSNDGTTGGGAAGLRTLAASFAQTMWRYADARRRFVADSLADVIATLRGTRSETQNPLTLTIFRRKVEHLESDVKELTAENLERKRHVRELELGLAQAVVRECREELREALAEKNWNPCVQEVFGAFSKREGVNVFAPSRRTMEEELSREVEA